jgi:hypothetical protein
MRTFLTFTIGALCLCSPAHAQSFRPTSFVYIECFDASNKRVSRGSGVVVGRDGRVLTARHVIPPSTTCRAAIGTGATTTTRHLVRGRASSTYDAMIVRLVPDPGEEFHSTGYTPVTGLQGRTIAAHGVRADGTGEVSVPRGVLSTMVPDERGYIESDVLTTRGMSGGPVVLQETGALVGIVVGADFDVTNGLPSNFAVLAAQVVAVELELEEWRVAPPTDVRSSSLALIDLGLRKAYIEQAKVLGAPVSESPRAASEDVDAGFILTRDDQDMYDEVTSGRFEDATAYFKAKYSFATYSDSPLNYVIRYNRSDGESSAILVDSDTEKHARCPGMDLRAFKPLTRILGANTPSCIVGSKFRDYFNKTGSSLRFPHGPEYGSVACRGSATAGGASGMNSHIIMICTKRKEYTSDSSLNYIVEIGIEGRELIEGHYEFDDEVPAADQSDDTGVFGVKSIDFDTFLEKFGDQPVQYIAVFP